MNRNISSLFADSLAESDLTAKQQAVLQASLTLFSEKGFENTSTSDIAQMAKVAEGTVYKQFKTKEKLLTTITDSFFTQVFPKIVSEFVTTITDTKRPDFKEFLENLLQNRLQFFADNSPQIRIFVREVLINTKLKNQLIAEVGKLSNGKLKESLEYYQQQGQLINWPFSRIFRYIAATLAGYVFPAILDPQQVLDVKQPSLEATEFLLKGLAPQTQIK